MRVLFDVMKTKKFLAFVLVALLALPFALGASGDAGKNSQQAFRRKIFARAIFGRVRVVKGLCDCKVRLVDKNEDLRVRVIESTDERLYNVPGRWRFVENGEDFKIRLVDKNEDLRVRFVDKNEGPAR